MIRGLALRIDEGLGGAASSSPSFARARAALPASSTIRRSSFPCSGRSTLFHMIRGDLRVCRERADELMVQAEQRPSRLT